MRYVHVLVIIYIYTRASNVVYTGNALFTCLKHVYLRNISTCNEHAHKTLLSLWFFDLSFTDTFYVFTIAAVYLLYYNLSGMVCYNTSTISIHQ